MIALVFSYFLGILLLQCFKTLPAISLIAALLFILLLLGIFSRFRYGTRYGLAFLSGFLWVLIHAQMVLNTTLPDSLALKPIEVIGIVESIPIEREENIHFHFKIQKTIPASLWPSPGTVKVHWRHPSLKPRVGEQWQLFLKLKKIYGYSNPGSMNVEKIAFQQHLVAEGRVLDQKNFSRVADSFWSHPIDQLRTSLKEKIQKSGQNHKSFLGVVLALSMGDQSRIDPAQWLVFRKTGTAHLLSISGLHIGFIAAFFNFLFKKTVSFLRFSIKGRRSIKVMAATVGGLFAVLYAALAGFSIPAQRALMMIAIFVIGLASKKRYTGFQGYCIALWVVLTLEPLSVLSAGFWLSFSAVAVILYTMNSRLNPQGKYWKVFRIHVALFLGLAPITLTFFNECSLVSPISNLIAIPYFSFLVVPSCLTAILILPFSAIVAQPLFLIAEKLIALIWPLLHVLAEAPTLQIQMQPSAWTFLTASIGVLCLFLPAGLIGRYCGFICLLAALVIPTKLPEIPFNTAEITVLDVGQGLSTVVQTRSHVLVFDTGPKLSEHFDTGQAVVLPFLQSINQKQIDCLVISHADNDHSGGADSILKAMPVKEILSSDQPFSDRWVLPCEAGAHWEWDGVTFEFLHPLSDTVGKKNDRSCVLRVQAGLQSVLMTGDIEAKIERQLVEHLGKKLASTVLIVPHHGSKSSSTPAFIEAVRPKYAIITAGYANHYGHPKTEIVSRYEERGIVVWDSIRHGAIRFKLNSQALLTLNSHRCSTQKYWNTSIDGIHGVC